MIIYQCDAPDCQFQEQARVTALQVPGMRARTDGDGPVVYLAPDGWVGEVVLKSGARRQVCSQACLEKLLGREARRPTGTRPSEDCPACGKRREFSYETIDH
jgi:hypothetical protein